MSNWTASLFAGMMSYVQASLVLLGYWLCAGLALSFLAELPFKKRCRRFLVGFLPTTVAATMLLGVGFAFGPRFRVLHFSWLLDILVIFSLAALFLVGRKSKVAAGLGVVMLLGVMFWTYGRGIGRIYENLAAETRVAEITVAGYEEGGKLMLINFVRIKKDGRRLPPEVYRVEGNELYVEAAVVKFKEENALLGGRSIYVFRRFYGNNQAPDDGPVLDRDGQIPGGAKLHPETPTILAQLTFPITEAMEREVWREFLWLSQNEFASDKVDAAFNTAVGKHMELDRVYQVSIQHNGTMLFRTVGRRVPPTSEANVDGGEDVQGHHK